MKFYSEVTKQLYNTQSELIEAETKVKKAETERLEAEKAKKLARAERAKEVENALKAAKEAQTKATKLLNDFTKDYGYFHMSYSIDDKGNESTNNFFDLLTSFLN